jgi:fructose-1,6-bisphosphatase/inositol monophosphatase family enzyme
MEWATFKANNESRNPESIFIEVFRLASIQVACAATRLQGEVSLGEKPGQTTPEGAALTAVDLAAQDVILHLLHAVLPEVAVDAEEDTETLGLFPKVDRNLPLVVVDPIDGTLNYASGSKDYAVMGALVRDGVYTAAVVNFPARQQLFWAQRGGGCWQQTANNQARQVHLEGAPPTVQVTSHFPESWKSNLSEIGYQVQVSRCSAVDAAAPVNGRAAAAISLGKLGRRRAIGMLLTLEAGGVVKINGRNWQAEDPLLLSDRRGPIVVADSEPTAARILSALGKVRSS